MVKVCKQCGKEITDKEYLNPKNGRPHPKIKQTAIYKLSKLCYGCLMQYKQYQEIKKAVNNPKKRKEYKKKLQDKVDKGILTQEQLDAGLREVDEQLVNDYE
ncbi:MAG TPA: hypothetical protein VJ878_03515 [Candidatus Izemoplasmatales bacterium]|nr:hypothetical protein [Candidatus Izemoplasmatales bacterium]